jgi:hypothetical protein
VLRSRKLSTIWMAFVMDEYIRSGRGWNGGSSVRGDAVNGYRGYRDTTAYHYILIPAS